MSSYLDTLQVNTAITENTKLDLGHTHITTANFMQLNPILCKEMVPGESCDVNLMTFSRLQPLSVPTFGRCNIKERAFFVPMRTIFKGWNDFITDTPHVYSGAKSGAGIQGSVPTVSNGEIIDAFLAGWSAIGPSNLTITGDFLTQVTVNDPYDVAIVTHGQSDSVVYYSFTDEGRMFNKVLQSLGYRIVWDTSNQDVYSAMPILALAKIYMDWYYPQAYANLGDYVEIMGILNYDGGPVYQMTYYDLCKIFSNILYTNFDSDYFTSAWDNPNSPNSGVYSNFKIVNIDSAKSVYGMTTNNNQTGLGNLENGYVTNNTGYATTSNRLGITDAPFISPYVNAASSLSSTTLSYTSGTPISEYLLHSLHALTDYLKRHQLVGSRALDRYLARFGKVLSSEKMNRCNYIGSKNVPVQFGDVTSTADTGSYTVGDMTGKGVAFDQNFSFDFDTDEYGYLIVMSSIVPAASIWQGIDRKVMHITKTDFWTPEFDQLGVQAISTRELYNDNIEGWALSNSNNSYMGFYDNVFGFAPRYGEYKYMNDQITGDFVCDSLNNMRASQSAWHLGRTITLKDFEGANTTYDFANLKHRLSFIQGIVDHNQFNRIFVYNNLDGKIETMPDPFTIVYDFQMVSNAPMKPLYDTYEFEDKGRKVTEQNNGVKVN